MKDYTKSQKRVLADELLSQMKKNPLIYVITGDLGYRMWDEVRIKFPERFINVGAAEQLMIGVAVGLALSGKIPFCYSITPFLLYRPFETIRNYLHYDRIPVKLVGSGRGYDYGDEGISHWAPEDRKVLKILKNIKTAWPKSYNKIPDLVSEMVGDGKPWYINLTKI